MPGLCQIRIGGGGVYLLGSFSSGLTLTICGQMTHFYMIICMAMIPWMDFNYFYWCSFIREIFLSLAQGTLLFVAHWCTTCDRLVRSICCVPGYEYLICYLVSGFSWGSVLVWPR